VHPLLRASPFSRALAATHTAPPRLRRTLPLDCLSLACCKPLTPSLLGDDHRSRMKNSVVWGVEGSRGGWFRMLTLALVELMCLAFDDLHAKDFGFRLIPNRQEFLRVRGMPTSAARWARDKLPFQDLGSSPPFCAVEVHLISAHPDRAIRTMYFGFDNQSQLQSGFGKYSKDCKYQLLT
jgi:hypothetical protein